MSRWGLQQSGQFGKRDFLFSKLVNNEEVRQIAVDILRKVGHHLVIAGEVDDVVPVADTGIDGRVVGGIESGVDKDMPASVMEIRFTA